MVSAIVVAEKEVLFHCYYYSTHSPHGLHLMDTGTLIKPISEHNIVLQMIPMGI